MNKDTQTLIAELRKASKGLLFQSESDYAIEPFGVEGNDKKTISAEDLLKATGSKAKGTTKQMSLEEFFKNATTEQDWQDAQARQTVKRFQALVKILKDKLSDINVYQIGDTEADVFVVGKTASGDFAGVSTKVVET
jgi:predicted ATPase